MSQGFSIIVSLLFGVRVAFAECEGGPFKTEDVVGKVFAPICSTLIPAVVAGREGGYVDASMVGCGFCHHHNHGWAVVVGRAVGEGEVVY